MKLAGVMLGSENPKRLGEFYTKICGEPGWHEDEWYGFEVGGGSLMIGGHSEVKDLNKEPARIIISMEVEDVEAEFKRIVEIGAGIVAEPYHPMPDTPELWLATLKDPDGNYIQLSTPWEG